MAKGVLLRDLEELRSNRMAEENPPPVEVTEEAAPEEPVMEIEAMHDKLESSIPDNNQPTPQPVTQEEILAPEASTTIQDPAKDITRKVPGPALPLQNPSPPSSNDNKPNVSLDIETAIAATSGTPAPGTSGLPVSSIDSLFDMPDNNDDNNNDESEDLSFAIDFLDGPNTNDNSQAQNADFDLSTFGNTQDFNMPDVQTSIDASNPNDTDKNATDDLFGMTNNTTGGGDMMDLDSSMVPAEENSFDDMFFTGDDGGLTGGGEMEHGTFDDDFFGLNN